MRLAVYSLLVMAAMMCVFLLRAEPSTAHGVTHPQHAAMKQGVESDRHRGLLLPAWCFGAAQLVFFSCCLARGVRKQAGAVRWMLPAAIAYLATFSLLVALYGAGDTLGTSPLWNLPWPTLLLVLGMWFVPLSFAALYVWKFSTWIYGPEDADRFAALKAKFAGGAE